MVSQKRASSDAGAAAFIIISIVLGLILIIVGFIVIYTGGIDNLSLGGTLEVIGWILFLAPFAIDAIQRRGGGTKGKGRRYKGAHGFRKFFKTHAEQFMNHSNVALLLGHSADALQASYYKPTESDVLNDYLKAVDILTIDYDKNTLTKQVAELKEKSKEDSYIIKGKLADKEKEAEEAKKMLENTAKELAELRSKQEEAAKRQQLEIDQIKGQIAAQNNENITQNLSSWMWDFVSRINERKIAAAAIAEDNITPTQ